MIYATGTCNICMNEQKNFLSYQFPCHKSHFMCIKCGDNYFKVKRICPVCRDNTYTRPVNRFNNRLKYVLTTLRYYPFPDAQKDLEEEKVAPRQTRQDDDDEEEKTPQVVAPLVRRAVPAEVDRATEKRQNAGQLPVILPPCHDPHPIVAHEVGKKRVFCPTGPKFITDEIYQEVKDLNLTIKDGIIHCRAECGGNYAHGLNSYEVYDF